MECFEEATSGSGKRDRRSTGKSGVKRNRNVSTVQGSEGERVEMGKHELRVAEQQEGKTQCSKNKQNQSMMALKKKKSKICNDI